MAITWLLRAAALIYVDTTRPNLEIMLLYAFVKEKIGNSAHG